MTEQEKVLVLGGFPKRRRFEGILVSNSVKAAVVGGSNNGKKKQLEKMVWGECKRTWWYSCRRSRTVHESFFQSFFKKYFLSIFVF